jgi:hypothetical protein
MGLSENIRRVVTTVDDSGKAVVLFDGDDRTGPSGRMGASYPNSSG